MSETKVSETKTPIPDGYTEIISVYGNPAGRNGNVNPVWEQQNIVKFYPPYPFVYVHDDGSVSHVPYFRVHKLIVPDLTRILGSVMQAARLAVKKNDGDGHATAYYDARVLQTLAEHRCNVFSGSFNYRPKRGQSVPSVHSFGVALDFDADHNAFGAQEGTLPDCFIMEFTDAGWVWGGLWQGANKDWMHFERCQGY